MKKCFLIVFIFQASFVASFCTNLLNHKKLLLESTRRINHSYNSQFFSKTLNENNSNSHIKLSQDGKFLSKLEYNSHNNLVLKIENIDQKITTSIILQDIYHVSEYGFCYNSDYLWLLVDSDGTERHGLFSVNHKTLQVNQISNDSKDNVKILKISKKYPNNVLVMINQQGHNYYDIYNINVATKQSTFIYKNNEQFINFLANVDFNLCFATKAAKDCKMEIYKNDLFGTWVLLDTINFEDYRTTELLHMSADNKKLYIKDSRNRDTVALVEMDTASGVCKTLAFDEQADLSKIIINPQTLEVEAACFTYIYDNWTFFDNFDPDVKNLFVDLRKKHNCNIDVLSRSFCGRFWLIKLENSSTLEHSLYDSWQKKFVKRISLEKTSFKTVPITIDARDGTKLVSYLTSPIYEKTLTSIDCEKYPLILLVHGGPWLQDKWGINPLHQHFANQGYAVLSVNFRGSTGFGKKFLNASSGEWGGKMLEDLLDATQWAVDNNIADPQKIAIFGSSYGGYAVLCALAFYPQTFACGVSLSGQCNLITLLKNLPEDWVCEKEWFTKMLIGQTCKDDSALLASRSPFFFADKIRRPLLLGHGNNDPTVTSSESSKIFKKLKSKNLPAVFALFPDEGHYLVQPENNKAFTSLANQFLAKYLKDEDITFCGKSFDRSSMLLQTSGV